MRTISAVLVILISAPLHAKDTQLRLYRPFTETPQQLPITITSQQTGACTQQSSLIKREDAWRCVVDDKVHDPCFVQRFGSRLNALCITSPWSNQGVQITVKNPLDNGQHASLDMSRTYPWALELTTGEKCQAVEATLSYDGLPVHYQCEGNSTLMGHVQRCQSVWKVLQHTSTGVQMVQIARAWF